MELHELTDKAIDYILDELEAPTKPLSPSTQSFVESIADQWRRNRRLSDPQKEALGKIWDRQ
jgi:hypothetical protein